MKIGVFTPFCEEDAHYADQWLAEVERLGFPFAVHFDRCSSATKCLFIEHELCVGWTEMDDPATEYTEKHKQGAMDILMDRGFDWALHWDADETWEESAPTKFAELGGMADKDLVRVQWVNLWGDKDHVRIDTLFASSWRVKVYNLQNGRRWIFDHPITYGCKLSRGGKALDGVGTADRLDLRCLHHGLMTRELREMHKARWDRILTKAVGNVPLRFWEYCLMEEQYPPTVVPLSEHRKAIAAAEEVTAQREAEAVKQAVK